MNSDSETEPLREWNHLARQNAENAIVSSMFEAMAKSNKPMEAFSTWLLVAAAAVASFMIVNAENIFPIIKHQGFIVCGIFLCVSCFFGLMSKIFALRCRLSIEANVAVRQTFSDHLAAHKAEEKQIQENAEFWGVNLQTGVRLERIVSEFLAPMPSWVRWWANRHIKKHGSNPQIAYLSQIKSIHAQGVCGFTQAVCFLGFLASGFVFAAPI